MNKHKQKRRDDRQRDDALEAYINSISNLLVGKSLSILAKQKARGTLETEQQDLLDAGINIIRARTLLIFRRLADDEDRNRTDEERKSSILLFLYETGLIRNQKENEQGQEDIAPKQFQALLSLSGANLSGASLIGANLIGANLSDANLIGANLSNANLSDANFSGASLIGANLSFTNLSDANLRGADLSEVNLSRANLRGADLSGASLIGAILSNAKLIDANLSNASLSGAKLSDANFHDANLSGADLSNANLRRANLSGADLTRADLTRAILLAVDLSHTKSLTPQQLEVQEQPLLCKAKLPKDIEVDPNRDCRSLLEVLLYRYPELFKNLAEAQAYVDELSPGPLNVRPPTSTGYNFIC